MKKKEKEIGTRRKAVADDRPPTGELSREDLRPDSPPGPAVGRDEKLIGVRRFPRKGDDDMSP